VVPKVMKMKTAGFSQTVSQLAIYLIFLDNRKIGQKDATPNLRMPGNKLMNNRKEEKRL
jgi:hypothetical protein